jgi:hypothetical protein
MEELAEAEDAEVVLQGYRSPTRRPATTLYPST